MDGKSCNVMEGTVWVEQSLQFCILEWERGRGEANPSGGTVRVGMQVYEVYKRGVVYEVCM
jgi:hypothetical protein